MATIALAIIGNTIAPGIGQIIGATIGSYIDQAFIFPTVFGRDAIEGPRISDIPLQTSTEGSPIRRTFGPKNRVPGHLIWAGKLEEIEGSSGGGGGKGGSGGAEVTEYTYRMDVAVAWGSGEIEVDGVTKVWANNKLIVDTPDQVSITDHHFDSVDKYDPGYGDKVMIIRSKTTGGGPDLKRAGLVSGVDCTISGFTDWSGSGGPDLTPNNGTFRVKRTSVSTSVDEVQLLNYFGVPSSGSFRFQLDGDNATTTCPWNATSTKIKNALESIDAIDVGGVIVSGDLPNAVNITFSGELTKGKNMSLLTIIENKTGHTLSVTELTRGERETGLYVYNDNVVVDVAPWEGNIITIQQDPPTESTGKMESVSHYVGSMIQNPDTVIEMVEGDGAVPGYRNIAYSVFEGLKLNPFGNRLPQFEAMIEADALTYTVGDCIAQLLTDAGLDPSDYDTSALDDLLQGFVVSGPQRTNEVIERLLIAYDYAARMTKGVLTFYKRGSELASSIDRDDLAARTFGDAPPSAIEFTDIDNYALPSEVNVKYRDVDIDHEPGSQRERRPNVSNQVTKVLNLGDLAMTAKVARDIAARVLYEQWNSRQKVVLTLPWSYMRIEPGDILSIPPSATDPNSYKIRAITVTRGFNRVIHIEGVIENRPLLAWNSQADDGNGGGDTLYSPPETVLCIADIPALSSDYITTPGVYGAICNEDDTAEWRGAGMYKVSLLEDDFIYDSAYTIEATIGLCETILGDGSRYYWDDENTLDVQVFHGTLVSSTDANVLNGLANWALIGQQQGTESEMGEIIGFVTVTPLGDNRYRLSRLLRGRRNTHYLMGSHIADEVFLLLTNQNLGRSGIDASKKGLFYRWKGVAIEGAEASWPVGWSANYNIECCKPFSPVHIESIRDGSNNLDFSWLRRSRGFWRMFSSNPAPLYEAVEKYEIDVFNGPGGNVLNTYIVSSATIWQYTAANQSADYSGVGGWSLGDPVYIQIHQIGDIVGRGYPSEEYTSV